MVKQVLNLGTVADDGTGTEGRAGGDLINDNFSEIYEWGGNGTALTALDAIAFSGDYTVTEADVTAHEAALEITESQITDLGTYAAAADLTSHTGNTSNPHTVTKTQVGLGNVDNTADASKPISTATQTALDLKAPLASPVLTTPNLGTPSAINLTNATSLPSSAMPANQKLEALEFIIDGGGSAITTGVKGYLEVPYACTITAARLLANQTGSIAVDIWKDTYANFPPLDADSITASAVPTISAAVKADTTLTGWTTAVAAGDILAFNVDSVTDIQRVSVVLAITIT